MVPFATLYEGKVRYLEINNHVNHFYMSTQEHTVIQLKAYSPGELANLYEVNIRTLNRWLEPHQQEIGERRGRYYTVAQVETIFTKLGYPISMLI